MRLRDLDPHWLMKDGARVGFVFVSPTRTTEWMYQSCFEDGPAIREQLRLFARLFPGEPWAVVQPCRQGARWAIAGGIESATWDTMTVTPSLDGSAGGNWHGFITNGEMVGGL